MAMFYSELEDSTGLLIKPKFKWRKPADYLFAMVLLMPMYSIAAEIRGVVNFTFDTAKADNLAIKDIPITIALFPLDGQILPDIKATTHQLNITNKRLDPIHITIQRGDEIQFVNNDMFIHQFQLLGNGSQDKLELAGKGQRDATMAISFGQNGRTHIFCTIHAGTYGRIDVIDTPYIKVIDGPGEFEFKDIEAGRWQVQISAPHSDQAVTEAEAFTAPPPVKVALRFHVKKAHDTHDSIMKNVTSLFPE